MRKASLCLCIILMACISQLALAEEIFGEPIEMAFERPTSVQKGTSITVASPNAMSGYFSTEMWGNNTADMDVRVLLHGYETVSWTRGVGLAINSTVVKNIQTAQASDGTVIYTIQIAEGLTYNDGTKITAKDYAFYYLLAGAPAIAEIGGTTQGLGHIVGYDEYRHGESESIEGVRILSENALELHVYGDYFPYFYGVVLINSKPYPISVIAPGSEVKDDGNGAYISGDFSSTLLEKTLLDRETGYLYFPMVTCGPYSLESHNLALHTASFVVNERFVGNYEGHKPVIERIVFQYAKEEDAVSLIHAGKLDLMNKIGDSNNVAKDIEEYRSKDELFDVQQTTYLRTGFAFLAFACEASPTDSVEVRKAIAMSIDRDALIAETMPNMALRVDGYYGLGQWMVTYNDDGESSDKEALVALDEVQKNAIGKDLELAIELLESDGWSLNENGEKFISGQDSVRHKMVDGQLVPLEILWALSTDHPYSLGLRKALEESLPAIGVSLTIEELSFPALLAHYYRQEHRRYDMFFMASNFGFVFDPFYDFNTAEEYQGMVNASGLRDEALMNLARDMRETDMDDLRTYIEKWIAFQNRFADLMPMIPLYSNIYMDIYTDRLEGYDITSNSGWAYAIIYAYINE